MADVSDLPVLLTTSEIAEMLRVTAQRSATGGQTATNLGDLAVTDDPPVPAGRGCRVAEARSSGPLTGRRSLKGRGIHDLRHTAACLWISLGANPVTVEARMGHASIATTNLYLHHLGTAADRAGLDRLNVREG